MRMCVSCNFQSAAKSVRPRHRARRFGSENLHQLREPMASLIDVHWFVVRTTDTATERHKCSAVKRSRRAQTVLGDRHDPVERICLQVSSAACGTRPAEFFNGWHAHRFACAPSGPCPARVCKPSRSPRRRGAACLSARICVPRRAHKTF